MKQHVDGIEAYRARLRALEATPVAGIERLRGAVHKHREGSAQRLRAWSRATCPLIEADARQRLARVRSRIGGVSPADYAPALSAAAELAVRDETRHTLLLAGLLDPDRTGGALAAAFRHGLVGVLRQAAAGQPAELPRLNRLAAIPPAAFAVTPATHGAEWRKIDVFARALRGERYEAGLVIEAKVRTDTPEQPRQLLRYHDRVATRWRGAAGRTVFVFLTLHRREPTSAGVTRSRWIYLPLLIRWSGSSGEGRGGKCSALSGMESRRSKRACNRLHTPRVVSFRLTARMPQENAHGPLERREGCP